MGVPVVFGIVPSVPLARVERSGLEESVHSGDVAVVDASNTFSACVRA